MPLKAAIIDFVPINFPFGDRLGTSVNFGVMETSVHPPTVDECLIRSSRCSILGCQSESGTQVDDNAPGYLWCRWNSCRHGAPGPNEEYRPSKFVTPLCQHKAFGYVLNAGKIQSHLFSLSGSGEYLQHAEGKVEPTCVLTEQAALHQIFLMREVDQARRLPCPHSDHYTPFVEEAKDGC